LWHLLRHPAEEALWLLRDRIQRYNVSTGVMNTDQAGYHETITRFYVWVINRFLRCADRSTEIDQLAEDERDVIIHIHLLRTPVQQVAQELGRTEKAVASLLCRAMGKLRKNLVVNPS